MSSIPPIYVVSFKNPARKERMTNRFQALGVENVVFISEVYVDDPRITQFCQKSEYERINKRTWSIMLQHLDAVRDFYENTDAHHCIICEDDIHLSKMFPKNIQDIVYHATQQKIDVLMLGYLLPFKIEESFNDHFPIILQNEMYRFHRYPNDIWGVQMYLISRPYAKYLLETFTPSFALDNLDTLPYSPDWILTKNGNRALINPMMAVEEGINVSDCFSQQDFHRRCFETHFDPNMYI